MSEIAKLQELHRRLAKIIEADGGPSKTSSGNISICFECPFSYRSEDPPKIWISINGYDIGDWSRHEEWGPFLDFTEALGHMLQKVEEAEEIFKRENQLGEE